jgi:ssDNA-binding Zn-finger/Zn-ribbon topoisomerase 1
MDKCKKCGEGMIVRSGRFGEFLACPNSRKGDNHGTQSVEDKSVQHTKKHYSGGLLSNAFILSPKPKQESKLFISVEYENTTRCPYCGDKIGFSFGTGDCGCQYEPDVGF